MFRTCRVVTQCACVARLHVSLAAWFLSCVLVPRVTGPRPVLGSGLGSTPHGGCSVVPGSWVRAQLPGVGGCRAWRRGEEGTSRSLSHQVRLRCLPGGQVPPRPPSAALRLRALNFPAVPQGEAADHGHGPVISRQLGQRGTRGRGGGPADPSQPEARGGQGRASWARPPPPGSPPGLALGSRRAGPGFQGKA